MLNHHMDQIYYGAQKSNRCSTSDAKDMTENERLFSGILVLFIPIDLPSDFRRLRFPVWLVFFSDHYQSSRTIVTSLWTTFRKIHTSHSFMWHTHALENLQMCSSTRQNEKQKYNVS